MKRKSFVRKTAKLHCRRVLKNKPKVNSGLWVTMLCQCSQSVSRSVMSNSLQPHARLLGLWNSPGKNTGVGCHALLQGIFPTQGLNPGLLHCRFFTIWATREVLKFHLSCALALTIMIDKESHLTDPGGTSGKEPNCQWGGIIDIGFIPGSGRAPGGGDGNPLQYPCLGNPLDRGACWAIVRGVANSWTRLKWLVCMQDSWNDCDWLTSQEALEIVGN